MAVMPALVSTYSDSAPPALAQVCEVESITHVTKQNCRYFLHGNKTTMGVDAALPNGVEMRQACGADVTRSRRGQQVDTGSKCSGSWLKQT
jgi:hypothetical protein